MKSRGRSGPTTLSFIAFFAALNVIANFVPVSLVLGFNSRLTLGWAFSPLTGLMLGPLAGGVSCLLASLIGLYAGQPVLALGPGGFLSSALAGLQTGLIASGKWKPATTILGLLVISWLLLPTGKDATTILVFHMLGLALIAIFRGRLAQDLTSNSRRRAGFAVWVSSYFGNITRHLYGNLLLSFLGVSASVFLLALPLTLLEQLFFSFVSFTIGTSLVRLKLRDVTFIG